MAPGNVIRRQNVGRPSRRFYRHWRTGSGREGATWLPGEVAMGDQIDPQGEDRRVRWRNPLSFIPVSTPTSRGDARQPVGERTQLGHPSQPCLAEVCAGHRYAPALVSVLAVPDPVELVPAFQNPSATQQTGECSGAAELEARACRPGPLAPPTPMLALRPGKLPPCRRKLSAFRTELNAAYRPAVLSTLPRDQPPEAPATRSRSGPRRICAASRRDFR